MPCPLENPNLERIRMLPHLSRVLMAGFIVAALALPAQAQRQKGGWGGGGGDRMRGPGGGGSKGGSSNTNKARPSPSLRLPDQFRSIDRDNDGQIGLYEWSKADYASFLRLDLNHDGFLTPQELTLAGSKAAPPRSSDGGSSTAGSSSSGESGSSGDPPADAVAGPAESLFATMDKDKDGRISESEWKKSFLAPPKFEAAGIKFQFPVNRTEFYREYPKAFGGG